MPLIDLKTDLKSLKFGKDRPGGGSSNQPYIQKDIPEGDQSNLFNTGGPDFLLRGGLLAPIRAANDVSRLTQMFFDLKSPNGLLFTATENLLSRTAVKTEASQGPGYGGGNVNAGIYTPLSTIGQALVGFTGTHLNQLGLDPTSPMTGVVSGGIFPGLGLNRYEDIVRANNSEDNNSFPQETETTIQIPNPLYLPPILGAQPPLQEPEFIEEISFKTTGGFKNRLANIWYNKQLGTDNSPNILEYDGGPGSILGIGKTNIKFADQRTGDRNPLSISNPSFFYGTGNKDKYSLSPQSKDISNKLKGVTNFSSLYLPLDSDKETLKDVENPNRILEKYYVLDRNNSESRNALRWNNKTTDSWISPLTRGASGKYEDYTGNAGSLIFKDGDPIITPDGGYSYEQNWDYTTTKSGSLEATDGVANGTYQTLRWNDRTTGSFISPLTKGASSKYEDYTGNVGSLIFQDGDPIVTTDGGYSYNQNWDYTTTKSGSLEASDVANSQKITPNGRTQEDFKIPLGASSKYEGYTGEGGLVNITSDGGQTFNPNFENNVYIPEAAGTFPDNTNRIHDNNTEVFSQQQIINQENVIGDGLNISTFPEDFRKKIIEDRDITESKVLSLSPSYKTKNKGIRTNQGDPGKSNTANGIKNVFNYGIDAVEMEALDKITAMPMYEGKGPDTSKAINDLVKFRIAAINNDKDDGSAVYMHFRAFINSFQDNFTSNWNQQNYLGRGESFYTYGNFGRQIQMGFTTFAQSKAELIPMYKKLNYLASTLAPDYTSGGFMRGNLLRLTMGGYLYEQPGFITSLSYDIPQESTWEIGLNEEGKSDNSVKELPHMIQVQMSFTPIHNFLPQKPNVANNPNERYIALANRFNSRGNYSDTYRFYEASSTADIPGEGTATPDQ